MSLFERVAPRLVALEARFDDIERRLSDPAEAGDGGRFGELLRERGRLAPTVEMFREWRRVKSEADSTTAERTASSDPELRAVCDEILAGLAGRLPELERRLLGEFVRDEDDAVDSLILEIRAGVGGDEASLFAADLFRMYARYCERRGFKLEVLDESRSAVDGLKEVVANVVGPGAYAALKYESGGHRVQRVPETEAQGRIHTSAATVAVLPEATEVQVDVKDSDLRIEARRASGPGGQNVNKVSSAIRITHLPTGVVVDCQDEKSQHRNKAKALKILRSRLFDLQRRKLHDERSTRRKSLIGSGDRSERIRTYNFPQSRITDHRINLNLYDLQSVLEGDLDTLVAALTDYDREQRLRELAEETA